MKKLSVLLLVVLVAVAVWFLTGRSTTTPAANVAQNTRPADESGSGEQQAPELRTESDPVLGSSPSDAGEDGLVDQETRPATELYKSADEALKAVKDGATDYDDLVLEQFLELGADCAWCDSFYASVKDMMSAADTTPEQRSYYAEVLSISGRVENIQSLVDMVKSAKNQEEADVYAEALELAVGKDDVVNFLSTQLETENQTLKEASVAAITNQGSVLSANVLYKHTVERGDPDGYYSQGIGLGELIPDEEALPFLQDVVSKRDAYSHLGAKALLNNGIDGLRRLLDVLENSGDSNFDKQMISGLVDHVSYEDDVEALLKEREQSSKSEVVRDFSRQALADFNLETEESDIDEEAEEG